MQPVTKKWWDDVVALDIAPFYSSESYAADAAADFANKGSWRAKGKRGSLIWGDRVRVLEKKTSKKIARISARGMDWGNAPMWIPLAALGGKPLLELYVIDVGQGDGLLVVTPEGHHLLVDGGNVRKNQTTGKNAADFVDWKFTNDYLSAPDRKDPSKLKITFDAIIATHCDIDHFGGLLDLLDLTDPKNAAELDANKVLSERVYHAGLSWWTKPYVEDGKQKYDRTSRRCEGEALRSPDHDTRECAGGNQEGRIDPRQGYAERELGALHEGGPRRTQARRRVQAGDAPAGVEPDTRLPR